MPGALAHPVGFPHVNHMISCAESLIEKTKARWIISPPVLYLLEQVFKMEHFPSLHMRQRLAADLNVSARQVQVWFQNRRQRDRNLLRTAEQQGASANKDGEGVPPEGSLHGVDDEPMLLPLPRNDWPEPPATLGYGRADDGLRSVSPSPASIDAPIHEGRNGGASCSSASSPPMSPSNHDDNKATESTMHAPLATAAAPAVTRTMTGESIDHMQQTPLDGAPFGNLHLSAAAALPNVSEYLRHMERHQRAYANHTAIRAGHRDSLLAQDPAQASVAPATDKPPWCQAPHPTPHQVFTPSVPAPPPPGNHHGVYGAFDPGFSQGLASFWPNMPARDAPAPGQLASFPPLAVPRVPTAETPAPTDSIKEAGLAAAQSAAGALPIAHGMPLRTPPNNSGFGVCAAVPSHLMANGAASSLLEPSIAAALSQPGIAAALSSQPGIAAALSSQDGMLPGLPAPAGAPGAPGALPTQVSSDAASLSMLYAALSSHFAMMAQPGAAGAAAAPAASNLAQMASHLPSRASLPSAPLPSASHPSAHGFSAPYGHAALPSGLASGGAPSSHPQWRQQQQQQAIAAAYGARSADGEVPMFPRTAADADVAGAMGGVPLSKPSSATSANGVPWPAGHNAERMSGGYPHKASHGVLFEPHSAIPLDVRGVVAAAPASAPPPGSVASHHVDKNGLPSTMSMLEPLAPQQPQSHSSALSASLGANDATCGQEVAALKDNSSVPRDMSDEEVFSMFADEHSLDRGRGCAAALADARPSQRKFTKLDSEEMAVDAA